MSGSLYILNGANLNRLGRREPHIYGHTTLAELEAQCRAAAGDVPLIFRQSNREYELVDSIHEAVENEALAIIINPAAFFSASVAILDALKMFNGPIIELHISNVFQREEIYHDSLVTRVASGIIVGLGTRGYTLAIEAVLDQLRRGGGTNPPAGSIRA